MANMTKELYWQNFNLGKELHIAGNFIYTALELYDCLEYFDDECEVYMFLYNLSVGIERLEKVALILCNYKTDTNFDTFEDNFKHHNHSKLLNMIESECKIDLKNIHRALLELLGQFYSQYRYYRFNLNVAGTSESEMDNFISYLDRFFSVNKVEWFDDIYIKNDYVLKNSVRKVVLKISHELYKIIRNYSFQKGIFTREIKYGSKSCEIFLARRPKDLKTDILLKEIIVFLLQQNAKKKKRGILKLIEDIEPLDLDFSDNELIGYLIYASDKSFILDNIESHYEELTNKNRKERLNMLGYMGDSDVMFTDEGN